MAHGPARPRSGPSVHVVAVQADGSFRLRLAPGTNYAYFSTGPLMALRRDFDLLEHPNPYTAFQQSVTVKDGQIIEFNFPVRRRQPKVKDK